MWVVSCFLLRSKRYIWFANDSKNYSFKSTKQIKSKNEREEDLNCILQCDEAPIFRFEQFDYFKMISSLFPLSFTYLCLNKHCFTSTRYPKVSICRVERKIVFFAVIFRIGRQFMNVVLVEKANDSRGKNCMAEKRESKGRMRGTNVIENIWRWCKFNYNFSYCSQSAALSICIYVNVITCWSHVIP